MTEFDILLQLGSHLEKQNRFFMAKAVYLCTLEYCQGNRKNLIEMFVSSLDKKIESSVEQQNSEIKEQLMEWISSGEFALAVCVMDIIVEKMSGSDGLTTDNAVLYHCLQIYKEEVNQGIESNHLQGKKFKQLEEWYYQLKFQVRRIDMNIFSPEEVIAYIEKVQVSPVALYYMSQTMCFSKEQVWLRLWEICKESNLSEYTECFEHLCAENKVVKGNETIPEYEEDICQGTIAFIIAVSDERLFREAEYYISHLKVPNQMQVQVIPIRGASSITQAYNQGMSVAKAKYKVYMHQDTMLVNPYIIYEICSIFQKKEIGMLGVAGVEHMPQSGIWWDNDGTGDYRKLYQDTIMEYGLTLVNEFHEEYKKVEILDGVLLVTQEDIPWREDLFKGWHFYDISQCMEFRRRGYEVAVAKQHHIWCLHEQKWNKVIGQDYLRDREIFLKEYKDLL